MEIQIEKNVPLPKTFLGNQKFPFSKMEIGDSFFVEIDKDEKAIVTKAQSGVSSRAAIFRKTSGQDIRFITKIERKENSIGVRCWRVK